LPVKRRDVFATSLWPARAFTPPKLDTILLPSER
jgi:hypothetical protein